MLIDLILSEHLTDSQKKYMEAIKVSLLMLLYLVSDILDMRAIKEGEFLPTLSLFNP